MAVTMARMWRACRLGVMVTAAMASGAVVGAQSPGAPTSRLPIAVGDTVQIDAPPRVPSLREARVVEIRSDAVAVQMDTAALAVVPFAQVKWLAVLRGTRGHLLAGTAIGVAGGAVVGGAIYTGKHGTGGANISHGAIVGGVIGGIAGAIVGSFIRSDRWVPVIIGPVAPGAMEESERDPGASSGAVGAVAFGDVPPA